MDIDNEELQKDLEEQYAMLETEIEEDKKKKRYLIMFIFFLMMFLIMFGTTFSYFKIYNNSQEINDVLIKELYINEHKDAFDFDENIKSYVVSLPYGTSKITFGYKICENCTIDIKGNDNLNPGSNKIEIKIVNKETKKEDNYIIYVIVDEQEKKDENNKDLRLRILDITNHSFTNKFNPNKNYYITNDILDNEDSIRIKFALFDDTNKFDLKLNGSKISRKTIKEDTLNVLDLNVKTELIIGANKFEIIIYDENGNKNIYEVYLNVKKYNEDQKVINIEVEPLNSDGTFTFTNVVPGWESDGTQAIKVTNNSNYDAYINLKWSEVVNEFNNKKDLSYEIKLKNQIIKKDYLPDSDTYIIKNLSAKANSTNVYYFKYKYLYTENDQNIDQGKTFKARVEVTLQD